MEGLSAGNLYSGAGTLAGVWKGDIRKGRQPVRAALLIQLLQWMPED